MAQRVNVLESHLAPLRVSPQQCSAPGQSPDDIVFVAAVRTPMAKAGRGGFRHTSPIDLLSAVLKESVARSGVKASDVDDVTIGNVLLEGSGATFARMAMYKAGFPDAVSVRTLNRQCSSGLEAIASSAAAIRAGYATVAIAGGVEAMSFGALKPSATIEKLVKLSTAVTNKRALQCITVPMGETSERVAERFKVTREQQDAFAASSNQKALAAQASGAFDKEIVAVKTRVFDKEGKATPVVVTKDEGPRASTVEQLAKLRTVFRKENGTTTAGNSSQTTDGASALVMMKRSEAAKRGLPVMGVFRGYATVGCEPQIMGVGPLYAIPKVLERVGLSKDQIDVFEINEAFASQCLYCARELGLDMSKVNPLGGAIALGHPLGATGARQATTLLYNLKRTGKEYGVVSMCMGTGMGAAAVFSAN